MMLGALLRVAVVVAAAAAALMPTPRWAIERWYSLGLYPRLQRGITPLTNQIPIALLDIALLAVGVWFLWRLGRRRRRSGWVRAAVSGAAQLVTLCAALYLAFLALWGLNYRRVPIEEKVEFEASRITPEAARDLAREAVLRLNELHAEAHRAGPDVPRLQASFAAAERRLGARGTTVPGVPKRSALELYFRWAAIDGMTDPIFLEIIVNPDVLAVERPFVLAHEWGHLAGYADEDEANLIAWLACLQGDARARYSGWLALYGHVMSRLPRPAQAAIANGLDEGPRRDLQAIVERYTRAPQVVRNVARETYDAYLRANRVEEGIASYDGVVRLILGAGRENGWAPRLRVREQ
jgi:hypothetical protein